MTPFFFVIPFRRITSKQSLDKLERRCYNTNTKEEGKMKVKVRHWGIIETIVDVDDKFEDALSAYECYDDDKYEKLVEELNDVLTNEFSNEIHCVKTLNDELIYEN